MLYQSWSLFPPTLTTRAHFPPTLVSWIQSIFNMLLFLLPKRHSFLFIIFLPSITFRIYYSFKTTNSLLLPVIKLLQLGTHYFRVPSNHSLLLKPDSVKTMDVPGENQWLFHHEKPCLHSHPLQTLQSTGHCTQRLVIC